MKVNVQGTGRPIKTINDIGAGEPFMVRGLKADAFIKRADHPDVPSRLNCIRLKDGAPCHQPFNAEILPMNGECNIWPKAEQTH